LFRGCEWLAEPEEKRTALPTKLKRKYGNGHGQHRASSRSAHLRKRYDNKRKKRCDNGKRERQHPLENTRREYFAARAPSQARFIETVDGRASIVDRN
jgi:hypothetical protein